MKNLILIENDVFDIASRLKGLNENYKIYFNVGTAKYEIHNAVCSPSLQIILPFEQLDIRAIDFAFKTRVENMEEILNDIEQHNRRVDEQNHCQIKKKALSGIRL